VSLPVLSADALADPIKLAEAMEVLEAAVEKEAERIETAGGVHALSVVRWDEDHLHAHMIGLDPVRGKVDELHPGRVAKAARQKELAGSGWTKEVVNRSANAAYCDTMRTWRRSEKLATDRAAEEVREKLTALEQAAASIAAVSIFARGLISRIGGAAQYGKQFHLLLCIEMLESKDRKRRAVIRKSIRV
jgi:hypothetical protein